MDWAPPLSPEQIYRYLPRATMTDGPGPHPEVIKASDGVAGNVWGSLQDAEAGGASPSVPAGPKSFPVPLPGPSQISVAGRRTESNGELSEGALIAQEPAFG